MSETTFCLTPYAISHMPTARRCPSIFVVGGERLRPTSPLFVRLALGDLTYLRGACPRRGSDGVRLPVALRAPLDIDTRMFWGFLERSGKKAQNRRVSISSEVGDEEEEEEESRLGKCRDQPRQWASAVVQEEEEEEEVI